MLETVLLGAGDASLDVPKMKDAAKKIAPKVKKEEDLDTVEKVLLKDFTIEKPKLVEAVPDAKA